jgi:biotin transporter BioY
MEMQISQRRTKNLRGKNVRTAMIVLGVVPLFAIGFMFLGMFIDIQIILKYDYTPISFTFTFLFVGALIGLLLAFRIAKRENGVK